MFQKIKASDALTPDDWGRLGLVLYDGEHYSQALEAFGRAKASAGPDDNWGFVGNAWQGLILDLQSHRKQAVQHYREALKEDTGGSYQYGQYGLVINRAWVEARLKTPFQRQ
jgi:tetratricopeptide (TPR) repeat protein